MDLQELLAAQSTLIGKEVTLSGYLISGNETYVVECASGIDSQTRISLPHELVQSTLLDQVDCLVGGRALYMDTCCVYGILSRESDALIIHPHTIDILRPGRPCHTIAIGA